MGTWADMFHERARGMSQPHVRPPMAMHVASVDRHHSQVQRLASFVDDFKKELNEAKRAIRQDVEQVQHGEDGADQPRLQAQLQNRCHVVEAKAMRCLLQEQLNYYQCLMDTRMGRILFAAYGVFEKYESKLRRLNDDASDTVSDSDTALGDDGVVVDMDVLRDALKKGSYDVFFAEMRKILGKDTGGWPSKALEQIVRSDPAEQNLAFSMTQAVAAATVEQGTATTLHQFVMESTEEELRKQNG